MDRRPAKFPLLERLGYTLGLRDSATQERGLVVLPWGPMRARAAFAFASRFKYADVAEVGPYNPSTDTGEGSFSITRSAGRGAQNERRYDPNEGQKYTSREQAVEAISERYKGTAEWGNALTQSIVDYRAGRVIGRGIQAQTNAKADALTEALTPEDAAPDEVPEPDAVFERELDFCKGILERTGFSGAEVHGLGVEKEIEGQVAVAIQWNDDVVEPGQAPTGHIDITFLSWEQLHYKVSQDISTITWEGDDDNPAGEITYNPDDMGTQTFAFTPFNCRIGCTEGWPRLTGSLQLLERIDYTGAIWDMLNKRTGQANLKYTGVPIDQIKLIADAVGDQPFRPGYDVPVTSGDVDYLALPAGNGASFISRIRMMIQLVAGAMDIAPNELGFADIVGTRATASDTREGTEQRKAAEREQWLGFFQQLFDRAIELRNANLADVEPLTVGVISPFTPGTGKVSRDIVNEVLLPMNAKGLMSRETVWQLAPDIMPDVERDRIQRELDNNTAQAEVLKTVTFSDSMDATLKLVSLGELPKSAARAKLLFYSVPEETIDAMLAEIPDGLFNPAAMIAARDAKAKPKTPDISVVPEVG